MITAAATTPQARVTSRPAERPAAAPETSLPEDAVELSSNQQQQPDAPELVNVSHQRELRGAWVASIWNINFPSSPTASPEKQKQELIAMCDRLQEAGFNAVFFQVRPEGDALYKSSLEPWSASLTGTQGKDPGYDPLEFLIEEAHKRNLEVHAWLNPYRARGVTSTRPVAPHMAVEHPEHVHPYGNYLWMDPGAEVVKDRLVDVCADITKRYNVDGIHFDDYFYPYPEAGKDFPDQRTWGAYQAGGGTMSKPDWRRENVNKAIREVNQTVREEKDHVRFGVSPFGVPAPDKPPGISGFDQYNGMYADTQKWMDEGWVDYLAPQLYWPTTQTKQAYGTLLNWWADHSKDDRKIFAGNNLNELGKNSKWTIAEFRKQMEISRAKHPQGSQGQIWYHIAPLMENRLNIVNTFKNEFYKEPALSPALSTVNGKTVQHPEVKLEGNRATLQHRDSAPLRGYTVYRPEGDQWKLDRIVPADQEAIDLPSGRWAIAAATMHGVESQAVAVTVA